MTERIAIVGAGVAGASLAYALARRGARVTVVDAPWSGPATLAGAGIIQPWTTRAAGPYYELYAAGARFYPELVARLADDGIADIGYRRVGGLVLGRSPADLDAVQERLAARHGDAPEMGELTRLDEEGARARFPPLREGLAAVYVPGSARVDGRRLRRALLDAAQARGAAVLADVAELVVEDDGAGRRAAGLLVHGEALRADQVVVAAGAWTNQVLQPAGVRLPVTAQRGQLSHLGLPGVDTSGWAVVTPPSDHYVLAFDDSRVVIGATRESGVGFDHRVTAAGQAEILAEGLRYAPGLAGATLLETRVGFRPVSADGVPVIGEIPGVGGLAVITGFGAGGLTMGPWVGEVMAGRLLGHDAAALPETVRPALGR